MRTRHTRNIVGIIAVVLLLAAVGFARTGRAPVDRAPASAEQAAAGAVLPGAPDAAPGWQTLGRELYASHCASCHGSRGQGRLPSAPPVAGLSERLYRAPGGRAYLIDFLVFGSRGAVEIDGARYPGRHPRFEKLGDGELAALLSFIVWGWDSGMGPSADETFDAAVVAQHRARPRSQTEVREARPALGEG